MQIDDAEYPAYLKKTSYEDLLIIRDEIDRKAHPSRYAMVIAEIAERDKLPETAPTHTKVLARSRSGIHILLGAVFVLRGVILLFRGHDGIVSVTEHPSGYWAVVGLYALASGFFFYRAFKECKT